MDENLRLNSQLPKSTIVLIAPYRTQFAKVEIIPPTVEEQIAATGGVNWVTYRMTLELKYAPIPRSEGYPVMDGEMGK